MRLLTDLSPGVPARGLAIDETLLESACRWGVETIRLWVNESSIILGRSQSLSAEVHEDRAQALGIPILRRMSGGGTVVHCTGNLNVTVVLEKRVSLKNVSAVFAFFGSALARAMADVAPGASARGNGLYIDGRKVGGAAQARRHQYILYHTTVMTAPPPIPMAQLLRALSPDYHPDSVASRPRPVTSLSEQAGRRIQPEDVSPPIVESVEQALGERLAREPWLPQEEARAASLVSEKYGSDQWNRRL